MRRPPKTWRVSRERLRGHLHALRITLSYKGQLDAGREESYLQGSRGVAEEKSSSTEGG